MKIKKLFLLPVAALSILLPVSAVSCFWYGGRSTLTSSNSQNETTAPSANDETAPSTNGENKASEEKTGEEVDEEVPFEGTPSHTSEQLDLLLNKITSFNLNPSETFVKDEILQKANKNIFEIHYFTNDSDTKKDNPDQLLDGGKFFYEVDADSYFDNTLDIKVFLKKDGVLSTNFLKTKLINVIPTKDNSLDNLFVSKIKKFTVVYSETKGLFGNRRYHNGYVTAFELFKLNNFDFHERLNLMEPVDGILLTFDRDYDYGVEFARDMYYIPDSSKNEYRLKVRIKSGTNTSSWFRMPIKGLKQISPYESIEQIAEFETARISYMDLKDKDSNKTSIYDFDESDIQAYISGNMSSGAKYSPLDPENYEASYQILEKNYSFGEVQAQLTVTDKRNGFIKKSPVFKLFFKPLPIEFYNSSVKNKNVPMSFSNDRERVFESLWDFKNYFEQHKDKFNFEGEVLGNHKAVFKGVEIFNIYNVENEKEKPFADGTYVKLFFDSFKTDEEDSQPVSSIVYHKVNLDNNIDLQLKKSINEATYKPFTWEIVSDYPDSHWSVAAFIETFNTNAAYRKWLKNKVVIIEGDFDIEFQRVELKYIDGKKPNEGSEQLVFYYKVVTRDGKKSNTIFSKIGKKPKILFRYI
ncbi:hypothetical protein [Mycoplasmopsis columbinasalis]|uniref:Uncharacterized protein n=1 Tax=Mycoplasmopsis columbinasalis TaxID=114880 RepID=A0A449BAC4_9BACT|nr:hypothetical protein [Mycoplasmopsis columbinasalis]VEU78142.1 Uncharacterised protein [Mycoplasmopsis columbinasalis]